MIGSKVHHYRIVQRLGGGGQAEVYLAEHEDFPGSRRALKVERGDARWDSRFEKEARILSSLSSEGLVRFETFGALEDGRRYILMEYLSGMTLHERLYKSRDRNGATDGKGMDLADALRKAQQVAAVLAEVHRCNIVHCDIKPNNLMIVPDRAVQGGERVKVLDFGIASNLENTTLPPTDPGGADPPRLAGSVVYMAPEQFVGKVGPRSDVYALGTVLYEMLVGRTPFAAEDKQLRAHEAKDPHPPGQLRPGLPEAVDALVLRMLSRQDGDRPDAEEVEAELATILRGLPVEGPAAAADRKGPRRLRAAWGWPVLAVSLVVLVGLFAGLRHVRARGGEAKVARRVPPPTVTTQQGPQPSALKAPPSAAPPEIKPQAAKPQKAAHPATDKSDSDARPSHRGGPKKRKADDEARKADDEAEFVPD